MLLRSKKLNPVVALLIVLFPVVSWQHTEKLKLFEPANSACASVELDSMRYSKMEM